MTIGATWPHRSGGIGVTDNFAPPPVHSPSCSTFGTPVHSRCAIACVLSAGGEAPAEAGRPEVFVYCAGLVYDLQRHHVALGEVGSTALEIGSPRLGACPSAQRVSLRQRWHGDARSPAPSNLGLAEPTSSFFLTSAARWPRIPASSRRRRSSSLSRKLLSNSSADNEYGPLGGRLLPHRIRCSDRDPPPVRHARRCASPPEGRTTRNRGSPCRRSPTPG